MDCCVAEVLRTVVWLRCCESLCGCRGIADCCVAEVLRTVLWLRYCELLCGCRRIADCWWLRYCGLMLSEVLSIVTAVFGSRCRGCREAEALQSCCGFAEVLQIAECLRPIGLLCC